MIESSEAQEAFICLLSSLPLKMSVPLESRRSPRRSKRHLADWETLARREILYSDRGSG
jgi:hypothetical protein